MKTMLVQASLNGDKYNSFKVLVESIFEGLELERAWNHIQLTGGMYPPKPTGRHYSAIGFADPTPEELKELDFYGADSWQHTNNKKWAETAKKTPGIPLDK